MITRTPITVAMNRRRFPARSKLLRDTTGLYRLRIRQVDVLEIFNKHGQFYSSFKTLYLFRLDNCFNTYHISLELSIISSGSCMYRLSFGEELCQYECVIKIVIVLIEIDKIKFNLGVSCFKFEVENVRKYSNNKI